MSGPDPSTDAGKLTPGSSVRFLVCLLAALCLAFYACDRPSSDAAVSVEVADVACAADLAIGDSVSFDIPPSMVNPDEARRNLFDAYEAAVGDGQNDAPPQRVFLELVLNDEGRVYRSEVNTTSGSAILDSVGVQVSRTFRFTPAYRGATAVCSRLRVPVSFPPESP